MATAIASGPHPYFQEIERVFYNYRVAEFNRRYYTELLARAKRKNLCIQLGIGLFTAVAVALYTLSSLPKAVTGYFSAVAAVLSALAFVANVLSPLLGWDRTIDELTMRIHVWHYAERQLESALRFLRHTAQTRRDAELQVQFAEEAYRTADNLPDAGKQDRKLSKAIQEQVNQAMPPNYPWIAL